MSYPLATLAVMGEVVSLEAHRRRRLARAPSPFEALDRLELAVRRLDAAVRASSGSDPAEEHEIVAQLRLVTGAVASQHYLEAAVRAERLLDRLRRTS